MDAAAITLTLLDALSFACVASLLTLTSKEFRLHNLASGAWLVIGGWFGYWLKLRGSIPEALHFQPLALLAIGIAALAQVLAPLYIKGMCGGDALRYNFATLGFSLLIGGIGTTCLLPHSGIAMPTKLDTSTTLVFVGVALLTLVVTYFMLVGRWWASFTFKRRVEPESIGVKLRMALLIGIQIIGLSIVGATSSFLHSGLFETAEYRTVIPLLCIIAVACNVRYGPVLSAVVVIAARFSEAFIPSLGSNGFSLAITTLCGCIIVKALLKRNIFPPSEHLEPRRPNQWYKNYSLLALALIPAASFGLFSDHLRDTWLLQCCLIYGSLMLQSYLGTNSVAWPAFGVVAIYCFTFAVRINMPQWFLFCLIVLLLSPCVALFLRFLRRVRGETALVLDVALVVCLHQIALTSILITGGENVRQVGLAREPQWFANGLSITLIASIAAFSVFATASARGRARVLGLVNFALGRHHGTHPNALFFWIASILTAASAFGYYFFHLTQPFVRPESLSLENCLMILLFAYLGRAIGVVWSLTALLVINIVCGELAVGYGQYSSILLSLFIVFFMALSGPDDKAHENA